MSDGPRRTRTWCNINPVQMWDVSRIKKKKRRKKNAKKTVKFKSIKLKGLQENVQVTFNKRIRTDILHGVETEMVAKVF